MFLSVLMTCQGHLIWAHLSSEPKLQRKIAVFVGFLRPTYITTKILLLMRFFNQGFPPFFGYRKQVRYCCTLIVRFCWVELCFLTCSSLFFFLQSLPAAAAPGARGRGRGRGRLRGRGDVLGARAQPQGHGGAGAGKGGRHQLGQEGRGGLRGG